MLKWVSMERFQYKCSLVVKSVCMIVCICVCDVCVFGHVWVGAWLLPFLSLLSPLSTRSL